MGNLLLFALAAAAAAAPPPDLVRLTNPHHAFAVRQALVGAVTRIQDARCQQVLSDFRDTAGRTLRENLDTRGQTPAGFIGGILFYDGDLFSTCGKDEGVYAFTSPGSRVVFVCGERFHGNWRRKPQWGEVVLLHEALHSMGLGENPPSSEEITSHVSWSCAR
jgi:hypothetical protein